MEKMLKDNHDKSKRCEIYSASVIVASEKRRLHRLSLLLTFIFSLLTSTVSCSKENFINKINTHPFQICLCTQYASSFFLDI